MTKRPWPDDAQPTTDQLLEWCRTGASIERTVPDWPGYTVTTDGVVRGPQRELKASPMKSGHRRICLRQGRTGAPGSRQRWVFVHVLVLEVFVGPCPSGMEGCHANGDPSDNRLVNLRWDTHSANMRDAMRHGTHNWVRYGTQRWSA